MNKLEVLIIGCKNSVHVTANEHRDYFETVEQALPVDCEVSKEVRDKMIELDTLICIQFYPRTSIGSYRIYHYDLDKALDEALECLTVNSSKGDL